MPEPIAIGLVVIATTPGGGRSEVKITNRKLTRELVLTLDYEIQDAETGEYLGWVNESALYEKDPS